MNFQDEDEIVISGMSGKFPKSQNTIELAEHLLAGSHLMTFDERKLKKGFYELIPDHHGVVPGDSTLFDSTFFSISNIVSSAMDTLTCNILERTFEAIYDAGINVSELKGTNTTVFSGTFHSDCDLEWTTDTKDGYGIMGRNRCMNSNRVSYWLDTKGHSVSTHSNYAGGLANLFLGWDSIKSGRCDTAIVATANLQEHPLVTIQVNDIGILNPQGISSPFDNGANGTGRSSAVVVFVLQRAKFARRKYATIVNVAFDFYGNHSGLMTKPDQRDWADFLRKFYEQSKINMNDVYYLEAFGFCKREEDAVELNAITEVLCKDRKTPLLIGCIKGNIGLTEASSALCGIVKTIIAMEKGIIPQNINYNSPNTLCPGLFNDKLKVVNSNTPLPEGALVAVNAYGIGGIYGHMVLKANMKKKVIKYDNIPRLVTLSDRIDEYIEDLIKEVEKQPYDPEYISLLHEVHTKNIEKYLARGYTILPAPENPIHEHERYEGEKRPVWFVFSGMGSQWPEMGRRLMDLPIFRESIEKSHKILAGKGLDLIKIITDNDPHTFDNILNSFVGIAAIQIALTDILKALNITPDGMIGHSVGELGCAYADGCFTAEQMILAAYYRGLASIETDLIKGFMAAIGKGYNDIKDQLPEGIEVACHNSSDSCTLSGPADLIDKYVEEIKNQGIFAKAVNVSNIAYHSQYIRPAAPKLLNYLKQIITKPKMRSSKWISTSNPEHKWDTELAKYSSAEYHTNNLLSSVLFEEGSKHIPENAICIEIAPHGLLQAILKRSLGKNVINIPLTRRKTEDPLIFLLQAIGKLFIAGSNPQVLNLYEKVEYPVSRGTSPLHNLVHWHEQRTVGRVTPMEKKINYSMKAELVETADDGTGYIINGKNMYPVSVFLNIIWELYASYHEKSKDEFPVVFQKIRIEQPREVHLSEDDNGLFIFQKASGNFEVVTDKVLVSGNILPMMEKDLEINDGDEFEKPDLLYDEIYSELKRKGIEFGDTFKTLKQVFIKNGVILGQTPVSANWVQHIESLIQLHLLHTDYNLDHVYFPKSIERLELSTLKHNEYKEQQGNDLIAAYDFVTKTATCGGLKLKGLKFTTIPRVKNDLVFESTNFLPLIDTPADDVFKYADFCFSLILDDLNAIKNVTDINIVEVRTESQTSSIGTYLQQLFRLYKVKVKIIGNPSEINKKEVFEMVICPQSMLENFMNNLIDGGFIIVKMDTSKKVPIGLNVIGRYTDSSKVEYLFLKKSQNDVQDQTFVIFDGSESTVLEKLKSTVQHAYLVSYKEPAEGMENLKKRMQSETIVNLRWIFILDKTAPKFDINNPFYKEQIRKGLNTNVYNDGNWGWYNRCTFSEDDKNFALEMNEGLVPSYVGFDSTQDILKQTQVEYSGKIKNTKVMGISPLSDHKVLTLDKDLMWEVPEAWTLEDAATVPECYALAYYCLVLIGEVQKWENVLVTDGMTCLGQAAISVALSISSRVFVTVSNEKEIALIKKKFPKLNENDITSHEAQNFDIYWNLKYKDEHAHVIFNMLDGDKMLSVLNLVGYFGRTFHFGKKNYENNKEMGTIHFLKTVGFNAVNPEILSNLLEKDKKDLHRLMADGIKKGIVKPMPRITFTFKEFQKVQSQTITHKNTIKSLVDFSTIKKKANYIRMDTKSSYLIIGDDTDVWIDIAEYLISRDVRNIVVGYRDNNRRSRLRIQNLRKNEKVHLHENQDISILLQEAKKLAPISAVFYISMDSTKENQTLLTLNRLYRESGRHFVALSKTPGSLSQLCDGRNKSGLPSTNFVWETNNMFIRENLEFMGKICGRDSVIKVYPAVNQSDAGRSLRDLLPTSVENFCDLGASLREKVRITPLNTFLGLNADQPREICPLIFVPGLQNDPVKLVQPIVSNFLYPVACVQYPNLKLTFEQMASFILPEVVKYNKGSVYNLVGISWGSHIAIELTKLLEELGAVVGLILIDGPLMNAKDLITTSLESDLINIINGHAKSITSFKVHNDVLSEKVWEVHLNEALPRLNLSPEKESDFRRAALYVYNNLQGLMKHDLNKIHVKGPVTFIVSGQKPIDDKIVWKLSHTITISRFSETSEELMTSEKLRTIIHGTALAPSMASNTLRTLSWPSFQEYLTQKKSQKMGVDLQPIKVKFSFSC